jgi:hypothetical protein
MEMAVDVLSGKEKAGRVSAAIFWLAPISEMLRGKIARNCLDINSFLILIFLLPCLPGG